MAAEMSPAGLESRKDRLSGSVAGFREFASAREVRSAPPVTDEGSLTAVGEGYGAGDATLENGLPFARPARSGPRCRVTLYASTMIFLLVSSYPSDFNETARTNDEEDLRSTLAPSSRSQ